MYVTHNNHFIYLPCRNAILKIIGEMRKANGGTLSDFSEIQLSTAIADKIIEDSAGQVETVEQCFHSCHFVFTHTI